MKIKVGDILKTRKESGESFLATKAFLIKAKRKGQLFYPENISSLEPDETIHLFHSDIPPGELNDVKRLAFPIPLKEYILPKEEKGRFQYLKKYFDSYYSSSSEKMTYEIYKKFNKKPFKSEKCMWFHFVLMIQFLDIELVELMLLFILSFT